MIQFFGQPRPSQYDLHEAVILAGGRGTRLREVVHDVPKPMAPVAGRPFLDIVLTLLATKGMRRAILSVGYMADTIISHFGSSFNGIDITYARESTPLGTGGALRLALEECSGGQALVLNGDTYLDFDFNALMQDWQTHRYPTILGVEVENTARYGSLAISGEYVEGFVEKETSGPGIINAGSYVFPVNILEDFPPNKHFSLENDFLMREVGRQPFRIFKTPGPFIDIGIPADYERAQVCFAEVNSY